MFYHYSIWVKEYYMVWSCFTLWSSYQDKMWYSPCIIRQYMYSKTAITNHILFSFYSLGLNDRNMYFHMICIMKKRRKSLKQWLLQLVTYPPYIIIGKSTIKLFCFPPLIGSNKCVLAPARITRCTNACL